MPLALRRARAAICTGILLFVSQYSVHGFTKAGRIYATDGSQADVNAAITAASAGDVVTLPPGSFTWSAVHVNKAVTLMGAGTGLTTINADPAANPDFAVAVIRFSAAATVKNFTFTVPNAHVTAFSANVASGWRLTNIVFNGGPTDAYFFFINGVYGLIDNCTINGANGSAELIFAKGPSDSWQRESSLGGEDNVYVENCTFNGQGYVCDANSNARFVVRYCTINGNMKVDGHGLASNFPPRSVRHMEVYGNTWTAAAGSWAAMELRGGTGMVFNNTSVNEGGSSVKTPMLILNEYGALNDWPNFSRIYQTPANYPIPDQIGMGRDPRAAASEPMYLWNNRRGGNDWTIRHDNIPAEAILQNLGNTFTMADIIAPDRDYFKETAGATFNGSSGVGVGTRAQMTAITGTRIGVGFWVTDEGEWNATSSGADGQLYVWNGVAGGGWVLRYVPFTYPHPLRAPRAPTRPSLQLID